MSMHIPFGSLSPAVRSMDNDASKTVLLVHSDTTDGSTTFVDSSASGHTVSPVNLAQHDTAQHKWGASSIYFNGSSYLGLSDSRSHADFAFGTDAFSIDFWVRFESLKDHGFFYKTYVNESISMAYDHGAGINFYVLNGAASLEIIAAWSPSVDTWYHIAVVRGWGEDSTAFALCVDGQSIGEDTSSISIPNPNWYFNIGLASNPSSIFMTGWMDEFRVVKGKAMWTNNFIPPAGPY